ncbi:MAG: ribonuclease P protein component [Bacteroidetes bacterium]|nr:ribonuclease P protein component [Bacteroidota bacterium]MCA6445010.1 ribonuclease P protein component [Bacteroidota bacterium]
MKQSFHKHERLKSKKQIEFLFKNGKHITAAPIKVIYFITEKNSIHTTNKAMFVVPKKLFKHANDRNKLKRRMKEAYRLNKHELIVRFDSKNEVVLLSFIYIQKTLEKYDQVCLGVTKIVSKLVLI